MKRLQLYTLFILLFSFGNAMARDGQYGFVENKGQVTDQNDKPNSAVLYLLNTQGMNVQLRHGGFSYDTYVATETGQREMPGGEKIHELQYAFQRIDVTLAGSNKHCEMIAEQAGSDQINYYTNGVQLTNIHHYGKVTYKNIYHGIDLEFIINPVSGKTVEYNFIVAPGAEASAIRMQYDGAENTALADNKIKLKLQKGELAEKIPASYIARNRQAVAVTYAQYGANTYGFNIPAYDTRETLVIDPTPDRSWGTYYGGSGQDQFRAMTISGGNLLYATGLAGSITKIATTGAHKTTLSGTYDAVLAQFSTSGVRNWATYYGGTGDDDARAVAGNTAGDVYIGGETRSTSGFNVTGAHQSTYGGSTNDGFIAKFNNTGALQWSSYYGGNSIDVVWSIATNQAGDVYFAGQTNSPGNIGTALTEQPAHGGGRDGFLVKFSSAGVRQWGPYAGGALDEEALGGATDLSGNVYLAGNALLLPATLQHRAATSRYMVAMATSF